MMMGSVSGDGFTSTPVSLRDRRPGRFGFLHRHYHDPIVAVPARIPVEIHLEWAEHRLGQPGSLVFQMTSFAPSLKAKKTTPSAFPSWVTFWGSARPCSAAI